MHVLWSNIVFLEQGITRMTGQELIAQIEQIVHENIEFAQKKCQHFSDVQLNWAPTPSEWSIAQVFAHLNKYALYYHPAFARKIEHTKFRTPTDNFISSPLGKASWKSMKLGRGEKHQKKIQGTSWIQSSTQSRIDCWK